MGDGIDQIAEDDLRQRAQDAAARQDWHAAERLWGRCIEGSPVDAKPAWYGGQAAALRKLGRHDEADAISEVIRKRWPKKPQGWIGGAAGAAARKDWPSAERWWRECIERFPDSVVANWHVSLATALQQQGRAAEARDACRTAQMRFPDSPEGWIGEARLATAWRRAGAAWEAAADKDQPPAIAKHLQQAFRAFVRAGRFVDAARIVDKLKCSAPDQNQWLLAGLDLLIAQGDARGATAFLLKHERLPALRESLTANQLAEIAFEAGLSPTEAITFLACWLPREDAAGAVDSIYSEGSEPSEKISDAVNALKARRKTGFAYDQRAVFCRKLAQAFLRNRTCAKFTKFATNVFGLATERQIHALRSIAVRLFPASRIRLKIDRFLDNRSRAENDGTFTSGWRVALPQPGNSIADQLKMLPKRRLLCMTMVRDEAEMLPHFIAHHMGLGVRHFLVVDNGSVDGLGGIREGVPGADIVVIDAPFSYARNRHGTTWINDIHEAGICDWLLLVDADERLIFPDSENGKIDELLDHFDSRGETAMSAFMLDLYDENYQAGRPPSDRIEDHNLFYANHFAEKYPDPPYVKVTGGYRLAGLYATSSKTPLMRSSAGVRMINPHYVNSCAPAATSGSLLHYKIFRDRGLLNRPAEIIAADPRVRDRMATEIARHIELACRTADDKPDGPFHLVYSSPNQLIPLGYMSADEQWMLRIPRGVRSRPLRLGDSFEDGLEPEFRYLLTEQPSFKQLIDSIRRLGRKGRRDIVRLVLNENIPRIRPRAVKLGLLLVTACAFRLDKTAARVAQTLRAELATDCKGSKNYFSPVLDALATDHPRLVLEILDAFHAADAMTPQLYFVRAKVLASLDEWVAAREALSKAEQDKQQEPVLHLTILQLLQDWPAYIERLGAALMDESVPVTPQILSKIHRCPQPDQREKMLRVVQQRLAPRTPHLNPRDAQVYMSVLHGLEQKAALRQAHAQLNDRLPRRAKLFFDRILDTGASRNAARDRTIWCLGLSKTGTTSLHEYFRLLGLFSAHWTNPVTGDLLDDTDADIFDAVSDITVVFHAMRNGVDPNRRVIVTTRDFESWEHSFLSHYNREFAQNGLSYGKLRELFYSGRQRSFGQREFDISNELYFRHETLRQSYESHRDWVASLARNMNVAMLLLPIEANDKTQRVSRYLGESSPVLEYPHANPRPDFL